MFGLWKFYHRKFEPYDSGYSFRTLNGNKYVTPAERDELISSYRNSLKFDFFAIFKAFLLSFVMIFIGAVCVALFDLGKSFLAVVSYIAIVPILIAAFRPPWIHYRKANHILSKAIPLPHTGSWLSRLGSNWQRTSWVRIGIVLPLYGYIFYWLIGVTSVSPANWFLLLLIVALGLGLINFCCAAIWKIIQLVR